MIAIFRIFIGESSFYENFINPIENDYYNEIFHFDGIIKNQNVVLILGDNFFYGQDFTKNLIRSLELKEGSTIFTYPVSNPQDYGVVELKNKKPHPNR